MPAPEIIHQLVQRFHEHKDAYHTAAYNEAQLRQEFLNPFFEALGWDVYNSKDFAIQYREVIHEDSIHVKGSPNAKAPDYAFRLGGVRKFFVEAKKPAEDIQNTREFAYQLKAYAWSLGLPLSILTDFEEFAVYDCRNKPNPTDSPAAARVMYVTYDQYLERWDEIAGIFSPQAIQKGAFDKYAEDNTAKKGTTRVDDAFLADIENWRTKLAQNIALRNKAQVENERQLNFAVQMTIDRIIFLRICEDRGIEPQNQLYEISSRKDIYHQLVELFLRADLRYNSGLFHFKEEKGGSNRVDTFTPTLAIDDKVLKDIIRSLYYPCPYVFKEIPVEILGQVYEQFLGKVIRLTPGHQAKVEEKPEVRKAGGVYYTPKYIVDYIVANTVGKLLEGKTPQEASQLKIVDPACGSGSFLLGAFQHLMDWHEQWYLAHEPDRWTKGRDPALVQTADGDWRLNTSEKKRILVNNIYGVDIDSQAVEVTKLSLLLKVLEEETGQLSLGFERVLPDLGNNIKCGNSLIGWDYFEGMLIPDEKEVERVNPFDWHKQFPEVFASGGFDAVIGNPPYIFTRSKGIGENEKKYYYEKFKYQNYQLNTYSVFVEKAFNLINSLGHFGFIIPNNWLSISSMKKFRDFLISNSKNLSILNNKYKVFSGANVDTSIITCSIGVPSYVLLLESEGMNNIVEIGKRNPNDLLKYSIIQFNLPDTNPKSLIVRKVLKNSIQLGEIALVKAGLKAYETGKGLPPQTDSMKKNRIYHSFTQVDESFRRYLDGKDVKRYKEDWSGQYLIYGKNLAAPRDEYLFLEERILVRQIPSKPPYSINGVYIKNNAVNDINSMIISKPISNYSLLYILGIINSRLLSLWFDVYFGKFQRKIFPQFKVMELAQFPIHTIDISNTTEVKKHDQMVSLVEHMLTLHKRTPQTPNEQERLEREIAATDAAIDRLVYDLYGLTEEEIRIVEES